MDRKLCEADGGRFLVEAMRKSVELKQEQTRKTEKQALIFENLTNND